MRLTLTVPASLEASDTDARVLRGVAIPYGQRGSTSAGPVTVDAGAITVPDNLRAVKLFREHGRQTPIGYATEANDDDQALRMSFAVANTTDGDQALLEASEGLRDALSVELNNIQLNAGHVTAGELVAVAQVAVPAFAGAQLVAALTDDEQTQVNDLATQITDITATNTDTAPPDAAAGEEAPMPQPTQTQAAAQPPALTATMQPTARTQRRGLNLEAAMSQLRAAYQRGPGELTAALTDIIPANDAGEGYLRPQWLDELWTPVNAERDFISRVTQQTLTSGLRVYGWKWDVEPVVDVYEGNKTEIPTSPASTVPEEAPIYRLAGGWDIDRIYVDLGASGFLESFFQAATRDLGMKQESGLVNGVTVGTTEIPGLLDEATVPADPAPADVWGGIDLAARFLEINGANLDALAMSTDLWSQYISGTRNEVPWWVPNGPDPNIRATTGSAANVPFFCSHFLPAGTILAADRRAVTYFEASPNPIRVQAVNLPNGGVDLAVFSYQAHIVNDARGLVKVTVGGALQSARRTAKKKAATSE